ncbi:MAG: 2-C-methyl-D-erythritol 2,4-cyclodiphosphate synthase [Acidimicrobiales bacterium]|nr:2-C-methyl-D-erythritol 2,4-cyclodiphosphate synthase [Acidimicrobiales bacterium]
MNIRVGLGLDIHPFDDSPNRPLILGGTVIPGSLGLSGHSDGDILSHAITDAILGAAGLGDIGEWFPDTDPKWKNANSLLMLESIVDEVSTRGFTVGQVDVVIALESPKIAPFKREIISNLEKVIKSQVSIKATRPEGLGALGRLEGMAVWAVVLLEKSIDDG